MIKGDIKMLKEIREHLGKLHQQWRDDPNHDGHCKPNEGHVAFMFSYPNWHVSNNKQHYVDAMPVLNYVEVYSYLFGPSRLHTFNSIEEAHKEVLSWRYYEEDHD